MKRRSDGLLPAATDEHLAMLSEAIEVPEKYEAADLVSDEAFQMIAKAVEKRQQHAVHRPNSMDGSDDRFNGR